MDNERNKIVYCIVYLISSQYRYIDKVSSSLSLSSTNHYSLPNVARQRLHRNEDIESRTKSWNEELRSIVTWHGVGGLPPTLRPSIQTDVSSKFTHRMPRGGPTIFVIFVRKRTRAPRNSNTGRGGWSRAVPQRNVLNEKCGMVGAAFLKRRGRNGNMQTSNGVAVVRDGYWTRAPDSTLRAEFWNDVEFLVRLIRGNLYARVQMERREKVFQSVFSLRVGSKGMDIRVILSYPFPSFPFFRTYYTRRVTFNLLISLNFYATNLVSRRKGTE